MGCTKVKDAACDEKGKGTCRCGFRRDRPITRVDDGVPRRYFVGDLGAAFTEEEFDEFTRRFISADGRACRFTSGVRFWFHGTGGGRHLL